MPPPTDEETAPSNDSENPSDVMDPDQHLPASTMPEDHSANIVKDDPATAAASEELKHTSISDEAVPAPLKDKAQNAAQDEHAGGDNAMEEPARGSTPDADPTDAPDEDMRERISSPKKKRGRDDQDEDVKALEEGNLDDPASADSSVNGLVGSRTTRSAPEKKRPRDTSEEYTKAEVPAADSKTMAINEAPKPTPTTEIEDKKATESLQQRTFGSGLADKSSTTSAFANSGFASLASSTASPFGNVGASKPSVFGGNSQPAVSGFGALSAAKPQSTETTTTSAKPSLTFGGGASSGFGSIGGGNGSVFGSRLGNGFAGGSGQKLSSFAAPGAGPTESTKPAKAFGAPESDNESSDEDNSEGGEEDDDEDKGSVSVEEKKRSAKITRVHIEDGESGEATILQMRAKLFAIESNEAGWKERGIGTLKINVPKNCVDYDENGAPIPGSFDLSGLKDEDEARVARLIMRQENTHRVVLNTIIVRAMEFKDKPSPTSAQIIFTAFEGDKEPKPITMLLKLSEANARLFRSEVESIQHEML